MTRIIEFRHAHPELSIRYGGDAILIVPIIVLYRDLIGRVICDSIDHTLHGIAIVAPIITVLHELTDIDRAGIIAGRSKVKVITQPIAPSTERNLVVATISTPDVSDLIQGTRIVGIIHGITDDAILSSVGTRLILGTVDAVDDIADSITTPAIVEEGTDLALREVVVSRLDRDLLPRGRERMIGRTILHDLDLAKDLRTDLPDLALRSIAIVDQIISTDDLDTLWREVDRDEARLSRAWSWRMSPKTDILTSCPPMVVVARALP